MSDDVADAREALANLRAARETCCRAVTYSALRAAAISLETAALDAEEAFAALLERIAPLADAAARVRAAHEHDQRTERAHRFAHEVCVGDATISTAHHARYSDALEEHRAARVALGVAERALLALARGER